MKCIKCKNKMNIKNKYMRGFEKQIIYLCPECGYTTSCEEEFFVQTSKMNLTTCNYGRVVIK